VALVEKLAEPSKDFSQVHDVLPVINSNEIVAAIAFAVGRSFHERRTRLVALVDMNGFTSRTEIQVMQEDAIRAAAPHDQAHPGTRDHASCLAASLP
jgi:hypothetical protein